MPRGRYPQNERARARGAGRRRGRGRGGRSPLPFDSRAARESAELGNEASDTRASLLEQYSRAQRELGFGSGSSPYGATTLNREKLANQQRGIANTAGNSLYAGSTINARRQAVSDYDRRQKEIDDDIAEAQNAYTRGQAQTGRDEALGNTGIKEGAIERAAASEPQPLAPGRRRRGRGRAVGAPVNNRRNRGRGRV